MKIKFFSILAFLLLFFVEQTTAQEKFYHPKNEFRAVWIATVVNIDWPKSGTDSVEKQKSDYIEILETYKNLNFNAVIVQIRTVGDAFYATELAPWSRYLSGKEGQAPSPYYDPLEWMIEQAHQRGFEFHAWMNPYRATFDTKIEKLSKNHDFFKYRNWMIKYGEKGKEKYYYNPGLPEVQKHLTAIVEDVVQNYDIDAIHFDDYFYPYRVTGKNFNDAASYKKYGNKMTLEDWRRDNVNQFLKKTYSTIKKSKPWVQFGISPFGVWRNKSVDPRGSETQAGQTNYDDLYADPMAWMQGNYIDYILPQLYWSIDHKTASYAKLLKWWAENTENTNLYIGNGVYKIKTDSDKNWNKLEELPNQVSLTRNFSKVQGNAFYSAKCLVNTNNDVVDFLQKNHYKYPAIPLAVPSSRKSETEKPTINSIKKHTDNYNFSFKKSQLGLIRYIVVYGAGNKETINCNDASQIVEKVYVKIQNENINLALSNDKLKGLKKLGFTFIDFYGNESKPEIVDFQTK